MANSHTEIGEVPGMGEIIIESIISGNLADVIERFNIDSTMKFNGRYTRQKNILHFVVNYDKNNRWIDFIQEKYTENELKTMSNDIDEYGNTIFHDVANNVYNERMVKFILSLSDVHPLKKNFEGITPLSNAKYWSTTWAQELEELIH